MIMKLFIAIAVFVLICCKAEEDDPPKAVQLLEAILNETRRTAFREVLHKKML